MADATGRSKKRRYAIGSPIVFLICMTLGVTAQPLETTGTVAPTRIPSALEKYKTEMMPFYEIEAEADIARSCGLRSEQWFEVILDGFSITQNTVIAKYGLQSETSAIDAYSKKMAAKLEGKLNGNLPCQSLVNSPTMDKLDMIENRLTGGYH